MTKMFSLKNLVLFFTSTLGLLEEKLGSDWFKECISKKSGINRCTEYDFMASVAFLKKINNIAAFSPLCCDYIVLLQCSKIPFGSDDDEKIKKALKYLKNQLEYIVSDKCNIYTCSYEKNESPKNDHARYGYMCEVFTGIDSTNIFKKLRYNILNKTDAKQLYQKHVIWLKDASNGYITSPLKIIYPRRFGRIYDSFVFFNDIWAKKFDNDLSTKNFQLSNGMKVSKLFIHKKDYFKYAEVTTTDLNYQVVAIPYQEKKKKYFSRYMVYLVPAQHNDDLLKIWDSFYTFSNGKIRNLILKMNLKEIDLYISTVSELTSSFNLKDILNDALKYDSDSYSYNRMVTYFNVDENGAEKFDLLSDDFGDSCGEVPLVIADRPYISFVFDIQYERIIFLIKDTGIIEEEC